MTQSIPSHRRRHRRKQGPQNVLCVRVSTGDRALVSAVALLERATISAVMRNLLRSGAQARLLALGAPAGDRQPAHSQVEPLAP